MITTAEGQRYRLRYQCDGCPAAAAWSIITTDDRELRLCNHHYVKSADVLRGSYVNRLDELPVTT